MYLFLLPADTVTIIPSAMASSKSLSTEGLFTWKLVLLTKSSSDAYIPLACSSAAVRLLPDPLSRSAPWKCAQAAPVRLFTVPKLTLTMVGFFLPVAGFTALVLWNSLM